jgi:DNA polymerase-3 subunit delta'
LNTHNSKILNGLRLASRENRLHHAYILGGPAQAAKIKCVEEFAGEIFAEGEARGQALERIKKRVHPDFSRIEEPHDENRDAPSILDQIRELPKILAYPPFEARKRVVLVPEAAGLNINAFNSILKILEEPPSHTMFFLLCRDPGELLQTIVSRCQVLRFAPLADQELLEVYGERLQGDIDRTVLLGWAEGAPERAELVLGDSMELRREACDRLLDLWEASPKIPSICAAWLETVEGDIPTQVVIDSWEVLLRDLAFVCSGASKEQIRFRESFVRLTQIAAKCGETAWDEIPRRASAIDRFRVYRKQNGNLRLDFAALLSELQIFSAAKNASQA